MKICALRGSCEKGEERRREGRRREGEGERREGRDKKHEEAEITNQFLSRETGAKVEARN